jgi:hypothetical protein
MSLDIEVGNVDQVLLADGWHRVANQSFDLDSYEFFHDGRTLMGGGQVHGVPSTGATWTERDGNVIVCPVTAVLAVKYKVKSSGKVLPAPQRAKSGLTR